MTASSTPWKPGLKTALGAGLGAGLVTGILLAALFGGFGSDRSQDTVIADRLTRVEAAKRRAELLEQQTSQRNRSLLAGNRRLRQRIGDLERTLVLANPSAALPSRIAPYPSPADTPTSGTFIAQLQSNSVRELADKYAAELNQQGYPAEVLFSSDYPGLTPGYWVVYAGFFDEVTADEYVTRARELGDGDAFTRDTTG